jgi:hypothetical protein
MTNETVRTRDKGTVSSVHLYSALAELTTTTKNLKHDNRSPGGGTNLGYAECEVGAGVTPLRLASVFHSGICNLYISVSQTFFYVGTLK